jgi:hypothetical protein
MFGGNFINIWKFEVDQKTFELKNDFSSDFSLGIFRVSGDQLWTLRFLDLSIRTQGLKKGLKFMFLILSTSLSSSLDRFSITIVLRHSFNSRSIQNAFKAHQPAETSIFINILCHKYQSSPNNLNKVFNSHHFSSQNFSIFPFTFQSTIPPFHRHNLSLSTLTTRRNFYPVKIIHFDAFSSNQSSPLMISSMKFPLHSHKRLRTSRHLSSYFLEDPFRLCRTKLVN